MAAKGSRYQQKLARRNGGQRIPGREQPKMPAAKKALGRKTDRAIQIKGAMKAASMERLRLDSTINKHEREREIAKNKVRVFQDSASRLAEQQREIRERISLLRREIQRRVTSKAQREAEKRKPFGQQEQRAYVETLGEAKEIAALEAKNSGIPESIANLNAEVQRLQSWLKEPEPREISEARKKLVTVEQQLARLETEQERIRLSSGTEY